MTEQTITIQVPEGKIAKFNSKDNTIEFVNKEPTRSKSWEEFCTNHPDVSGEYRITTGSDIIRLHDTVTTPRRSKFYNNCLTTEEDAEGILALIQLTRLRDEWVRDSTHLCYWSIMHYRANYTDFSVKGDNWYSLLSFPSKEMAEEFFNCFKDLIEKAKKFI